jgi:transposase InsO family protein
VKFAFIRDLADEQRRKPRQERIPVALMCEVLEVSRSGYYAWRCRAPAQRDRADVELTEVISGLHEQHAGRLGIGRLTDELAKIGRRHSPKRVRRLARAAGLSCVHPRPYRATTIQDGANPAGLVDLVERDFVPAAPNQLWFTDVTYIRTWAGWAYLAAVLDGYTRKVVGWALETHMRTSLVTDALAMAVQRQRPQIGELIIHSDRGAQYTSHEFRKLALANGIIPSVGHTGICYDNAMAESFNATIKKELINLHTWPTVGKLKREVFHYIEVYYNRKRPHTKIGSLTPCEVERLTLEEFDTGLALVA